MTNEGRDVGEQHPPYQHTLQDKIGNIRTIRNGKLTDCDWTVLSDSPLTQAQKDAYTAYRQELRDLPASITEQNADNPPWPIEPVV